MASTQSLTDFHQLFISYLQAQHRSSHTILAYGKDIAQLLAHLAKSQKHSPQSVTPEDIIAFKDSFNQNYTPKSISRKLNSIKAFFRFLKDQKAIITNPAAAVSGPTLDPSQPRILTQLEYRALRDAARTDNRMAGIVELLLQTGIRIGELGNLALDDINKDKTEIVVKPYESRLSRQVPLNGSAKKALTAYLKDRPRSRDKTVFITKTGHPFLVRNIRSAINLLFKMAGIPKATVNDLRHTFIAQQLTAGTPLHYVTQIVGHKRLTTTEQYLKYITPGSTRPDIKLEEL